MSEPCPFCHIDDSRIVFQDELIVGLWDGFPVSPGHLLIITRRHIADWFDATAAEQSAILRGLQRGRQLIRDRFRADGFNIGVNIGAAAGQTISHVHVHLIPRVVGDVPDPTGGVRHVIPSRANYLQPRRAGTDLTFNTSNRGPLIRGAHDPLLPHMRSCFDRAANADLAVAFILRSGLGLLERHLKDLLKRNGRVRIVTGDYLGVTEPDALQQLLDLDGDLQLRVFEAGKTSFHPKAYIFYDPDGQGTAFVGSSNLTKPALSDGVEWNYRVLRAGADRGFADVVAAFEELFLAPQTCPVTPDWIAAYRQRRPLLSVASVAGVVDEPPPPPPEPHAIQLEALDALRKTREAGNEAGLVVLATGLGKTWLAAFDSDSQEFQRVLFVAHREEILEQAKETFRRIRPTARLGLYTGKDKSPEADVLFASIQTLGRAHHLQQFDRRQFDYIVVDEFHHASARTYRQLIDYFTPRFLLGLTATPERTDGGDLLALCQENLVYRRDLAAGIEAGLLCPFSYFGVPDDVDYSNIPWRSSRFDEAELTKAVATNRRAENALEQFRVRAGSRALGFCCSQRHADFMADYFSQRGVRAAAVHSGERSAPRASALAALAEGRLDILFAVEMFNEGLDLPNVDTVLMLRPTESTVIWLQQFGRGLRKADGKSELKVIDYIGNHRTFLVKIRSLLEPLLGHTPSGKEILSVMRSIQLGQLGLPPGCHVTYELEVIDIIRSILPAAGADEAIEAFYRDFLERTGGRPTAVELYHSGYNPRSIRRSYGSWTGFLRAMGGLTEGERGAVSAVSGLLESLETTPMTKSFKMLTLTALLNHDALPGRMGIAELTAEFARIARRSERLRADVGSALQDERQLRLLIEENPIAAWCGGKGTGGRAYFAFDGLQLSTSFDVAPEHREDLQGLVRELVDWRLAEYLDRKVSEPPEDEAGPGDRFTCKLLHTGGRPILKLPDRQKRSDVPTGWVDVIVNDQPHVANFVKHYINVLRADRNSESNVLTDILRGWFGPDAGRPGTRNEVAFERHDAQLHMVPVSRSLPLSTAEPWRHYLREDIPGLFGLTFNPAIWNQGFVVADGRVFLLVTLEKGGMNKDHQYEDQFLSVDRFQWQSQNKTKPESKHGQLIFRHRDQGVEIHLFVRTRKVLDGKAAPFIYCGRVDFQSWHGQQPISVEWQLQHPVPATMRSAMRVPVSAE